MTVKITDKYLFYKFFFAGRKFSFCRVGWGTCPVRDETWILTKSYVRGGRLNVRGGSLCVWRMCVAEDFPVLEASPVMCRAGAVLKKSFVYLIGLHYLCTPNLL
jgi:hypothetical protein